mgnify:CR=1 FL=1
MLYTPMGSKMAPLHSKLSQEASLALLQSLVEIPSWSGQEKEAADFLEDYLKELGLHPKRAGNNIWVMPANFSDGKPNVLLNGHIDTVQPSGPWSCDPHQAIEYGDKIYGLGANDAGAALVCLLNAFLHFLDRDMPFNLIFSATAEEETGGENGIRSILDALPEISLGIIGEPTEMNMAVAERGLLVIDGESTGTVRHAALDNPDNAIINALRDLNKLEGFCFDKQSPFLGKVHITVSRIHAGKQHNVTPASCHFVLDIRLNEHYSPREAWEILQRKMNATLRARSLDKKASAIPPGNTIVESARQLKIPCYGSNTLSNMACVAFPCVKIGPGVSARSHRPDEFICRSEINTANQQYIRLINQYISLL